jgi:hypothetical protein
MKINKIAFTPVGLNAQLKRTAQNSNNNAQTSPIEHKEVKMFAYQDYNISFSGRTPEDFYAQDFNRKNMPETMKMFLDYDYEKRQHIPPEQMMHEVFKYIEKAKDFDEVRKLYPNEELFENLHQCTKAPREKNHTMLYQMLETRKASDTPLLKDGSDDFGMYVLRKIYSEGKTLKEISKDFLEKDMSDTYRGYITKDIDYPTLAAYGIKFPKLPFWHSFIATRDEYRQFFLTLPKNMVDPNRINSENPSKSTPAVASTPATEGTTNSPEVEDGAAETEETSKTDKKKKKPVIPPRKHKIDNLKKDQIKDVVKNSDGNNKILRNKITQKLSSSDADASFVVKYLSPIMTIAANKIHLSEEIKDFCENEKLHGQVSNEEQMLKRFWNNNKDLRENYSNAIVDTIVLFEEYYGVGGNIPINSDFEPITDKSPNKYFIDSVPQEFLDLLNYSKDIEPSRSLKYQEHDKLQHEMEEIFAQQQEEEPVEEVQTPEIDIDRITAISPEEILDQAAALYNTEIIKVKGVNGKDVRITGDFEKVLEKKYSDEVKFSPTRYAKSYQKFMNEHVKIKHSEAYKLAVLAENIRDRIDDDRLMPETEFKDMELKRQLVYGAINSTEEQAASTAMADVINKHTASDDDSHMAYRLHPIEYYEFDNRQHNNMISQILLSNKKELDTLYDKYLTKPSTSEQIKIEIAVMDNLRKYSLPEDYNSVVDQYFQAMTNVFKDCAESPAKKAMMKKIIRQLSIKYPFMKCIIPEKADKNTPSARFIELARFEKIMQVFINELKSNSEEGIPYLNLMITPEILQRHMTEFSPKDYNELALSLKTTDTLNLKVRAKKWE